MNTSLSDLLYEALGYQAVDFDRCREISGADLLEWFGEWRQRVKAALFPVSVPAINQTEVYRFRSHLVDALRTLKVMYGHAAVEAVFFSELRTNKRYPLPSDFEIDDLFNALNNGGIQIRDGAFSITVCKHSPSGRF